jgi:hypothetical protein
MGDNIFVCMCVGKQIEHAGTAVANDVAELKWWKEPGKLRAHLTKHARKLLRWARIML